MTPRDIEARTERGPSTLGPLHIGALRLMEDGPAWIRTFQARGLKAIVDQLVALGLAERHAPPPSKYRNMLRLTDAGRAQLPPGKRGQTSASVASGADQVGGGSARSSSAAPADDGSTGARLARQLLDAWEASGHPITTFFAPLTVAPRAFLSSLRRSRTNKPETIDKILAFLANPPAPVEPALRAAAKRPPMPKRMPLGPEAGETIDQRRAATHAAVERRLAGETLADAVRRCGRELDAEEAAETVAAALPPKRSFQPIAPERWGQLATLAARMGVTQSAVLDLALGVGIAGLNEDLDEEDGQ